MAIVTPGERSFFATTEGEGLGVPLGCGVIDGSGIGFGEMLGEGDGFGEPGGCGVAVGSGDTVAVGSGGAPGGVVGAGDGASFFTGRGEGDAACFLPAEDDREVLFDFFFLGGGAGVLVKKFLNFRSGDSSSSTAPHAGAENPIAIASTSTIRKLRFIDGGTILSRDFLQHSFIHPDARVEVLQRKIFIWGVCAAIG